MSPAGSRRGSVVALALALVLVGCAGGGTAGQPAASAGSGGDGAPDGSITVFAAASLAESFTSIAAQFEEAHPGSDVTVNVAGSSDLVTQILEGAPADVLASADAPNMARVADAGLLAGVPEDFATNTLQLAVPPDNPAGIESLADAAGPEVKTVICAVQVPCGAAAATVAEAAGVELMPVSEESSVADVLGKVTSGEADAGLVYVTDIRAAGGAALGIEILEAAAAVNSYPIAALGDSEEAATAEAFVDFVVGPEGQAVLEEAGFGAP